MQDYNRAMIIKESDIFIYMLDYDEDSALGFDLAMVRAGLEDYLTSRKLEEGSALYGLKAIRQFAEDVKMSIAGAWIPGISVLSASIKTLCDCASDICRRTVI